MFKMIYNIARTELQMLFYSPVAWLILVVFGVQSGMLFADQLAGLVSSQEMGYDIQGSTISIFASRWGGVFTTMQNYLYFYIPLLTMSLVSKELSSGSDLCLRGYRYFHVQSDFLSNRGSYRYVCRVNGIKHDWWMVAGLRFYS